MTRTTPQIGDAPDPKITGPKSIKITRAEAKAFLERKGLVGRRGIKWARKRLRRIKYKQSLPRGREVTVNEPEHAWPIVYGTVRHGGVLTFMHNKQETSDNTMRLRQVITHAAHEIEGVQKLYLDANQVTFASSSFGWANGGTKPDGNSIDYTNYVYLKSDNKGTAAQTAYSDLTTDLPTFWTSNHRQREHAHSYLMLKWNAELFPDAQPDIWFEVKGKKVYDPRTTQTAFTDSFGTEIGRNPVLQIANFLTDSRIGPGFPSSTIYWGSSGSDVGSVWWAANICDESVPLAAGGTEPRYRADAVYFADEPWEEIVAAMEQAMGGHAVNINGLWKFYPGKYITPTLTLDISDVMSELEIRTMRGRDERYNSVRGTYVNKADGYKVAEMPTMTIAAYVTEDGGRKIFEDIGFEAVTSAGQAQRLAKIELEKVRRDIEVQGEFSLKALQLEPGDTVMLTLDRYGWSSKVFQVLESGLEATDDLRLVVTLELAEIDSNVYSWDETQDEQAVNQASATSLPDPFTSTPPSGLSFASGTGHLFVQTDGSIVSRVNVSWSAPDDAFVTQGGRYQIQYKPTSGSTWIDGTVADGLSTSGYLNDLQDGVSYDIRIRSINTLGSASTWVSGSHTVVGKTQPPSTPANFSANLVQNRVKLAWSEISDPDRSHYEIRRGASWGAATHIAFVYGTSYEIQETTAQGYTYLLKAIDTSGNASTTAASAVLTINAPNQVTDLGATVIDNNALIDWEEPNPSSLPVAGYKIYRGATFAGAEYLGKVGGTFFTYFSQLSGDFTYWITAIDTAGNEGPESSITAKQYNPPDYILRAEQTSDLANGALSNAVEHDLGDDSFLAPVITTETWAQHFTNNSWATIADAISAGFDIYATPSNGTAGYYEEEIDLGVVVAGSRISLDYTVTTLDGSVTVTPTLSYKKLVGDSYTDIVGVREVYADEFQFVKIKIEVSGGDTTSIARISNIQTRVDVKKQTDSGTGTSVSSGAVTVNFNLDFLDVESIQVTAAGNASGKYFPVYDFTDTPNPTSFDVYVFDADGNQVAVAFSWSAEGSINPG